MNNDDEPPHTAGRGNPTARILSQSLTEGRWEGGDWGPLERFVAEEYIADTLWAFEPGYRRAAIIPAAEQLGTLPLPADHPERCQFLVAETLFGEMLAVPRWGSHFSGWHFPRQHFAVKTRFNA